MERIKLKEAEAFYSLNNNGKKCSKQIEDVLLPDGTISQKKQKRYRILSGERKKISINEALKICKVTGVDVNFLFGYK